MNNRKTILKAVFMCIALILVLVILYSGLQILESTVFSQQQEEQTQTSKAVVRDGVRYYPRQDMMIVMLMGIERYGEVAANAPNDAPPVDMVTLLIFDEQTQKCDLLTLNRDTMVMMPGLNAYGREESTYYGQLALSHTYGTGLEDSCENTRKTVSRLLNGITIDHYYAMNVDAIAIMNDAVGGVTVTITDDFSHVDAAMIKGETTLTGQQALIFVQSRRNVGDQLNLSRMERQKEYMKGFVTALQGKLNESISETLSIYDTIAPYAVTDCSGTVMSRLLEDYGSYELGHVYTLPGENVLGDEHYEFYVDEEALDELLLELFYDPVN